MSDAVRLDFAYEGDEMRLVAQHPVDPPAPEFDLSPARRPGIFVEVRDAENQPLGRVFATGAANPGIEVFPQEHSQPIQRSQARSPEAFTVVVPTPETARQVAVIKLSPSPGAQVRAPDGTGFLAPAPQILELASFPLVDP